MALSSSTIRIGFVAVAAAAIGLVAYAAYEATSGNKEDPRQPAALSTRPEPDKNPLPQEANTLQVVWDLAWGAARGWQKDAKLTRLYAAGIHPDGVFQRATVDIQFVFFSRALSAAGVSQGTANGLRWALSAGKTYTVELKQYPEPSLDMPETRLCDLAELSGKDPPAEVTLDEFFTQKDGKAPVLSLFTDDKQFMVLADPFTCEVRGRATRNTADEADGGGRVAAGDAGKVFDHAKASSQVDAVLAAAASCKRPDGATGPGTVSVRFDQSGKVDEVTFQMGGYGETPVGRCIEDRIRKIEVRPWDTGRGFIIKRFNL
jgi:hypothetical protein